MSADRLHRHEPVRTRQRCRQHHRHSSPTFRAADGGTGAGRPSTEKQAAVGTGAGQFAPIDPLTITVRRRR